MQHKPKVQKASPKERNSEQSEDRRGGGTGWEWQNNDNMGKEEMEKKKKQMQHKLIFYGIILFKLKWSFHFI